MHAQPSGRSQDLQIARRWRTDSRRLYDLAQLIAGSVYVIEASQDLPVSWRKRHRTMDPGGRLWRRRVLLRQADRRLGVRLACRSRAPEQRRQHCLACDQSRCSVRPTTHLERDRGRSPAAPDLPVGPPSSGMGARLQAQRPMTILRGLCGCPTGEPGSGRLGSPAGCGHQEQHRGW